MVVSEAQAYKQFGNSVAIPAIQATAQQIINILNKGVYYDYGKQRRMERIVCPV